MKPDLVPWGNWFQSPSSYGFSCWQDWFEGQPKCQRQLPLLRRTLKDIMMIVNKVRTHMHTIFYNKLTDYNWIPQYCAWGCCEEDAGGSLRPIVEELETLRVQKSEQLPGATPHCKLAVPHMQEALVLLTDHLHMQIPDFHVVSGLPSTKARYLLAFCRHMYHYLPTLLSIRLHVSEVYRKVTKFNITEKLETMLFKIFRQFQKGVSHIWYSCICFHVIVLHCPKMHHKNTPPNSAFQDMIIILPDNTFDPGQHLVWILFSVYFAFDRTMLSTDPHSFHEPCTMPTVNWAYVWALASLLRGWQLLKSSLSLALQLNLQCLLDKTQDLVW